MVAECARTTKRARSADVAVAAAGDVDALAADPGDTRLATATAAAAVTKDFLNSRSPRGRPLAGRSATLSHAEPSAGAFGAGWGARPRPLGSSGPAVH